MASRMYEVQQKVFGMLVANDELIEKTNGVYDYVPENTAVPYVTFGHVISSSERTKSDDGELITVTLDIWSESKGRKEAVTIMNMIENTLKADVELDTAFLLSQKVTNREVWEETYGLYHGTVEIEFLLEWED